VSSQKMGPKNFEIIKLTMSDRAIFERARW
jgi:hypothetical protein